MLVVLLPPLMVIRKEKRHAHFTRYIGIDYSGAKTPDEDWVPRFNIAPTQNIPVIPQHPDEPNYLGLSGCWGLIPYWRKTRASATRSSTACLFRASGNREYCQRGGHFETRKNGTYRD